MGYAISGMYALFVLLTHVFFCMQGTLANLPTRGHQVMSLEHVAAMSSLRTHGAVWLGKLVQLHGEQTKYAVAAVMRVITPCKHTKAR